MPDRIEALAAWRARLRQVLDAEALAEPEAEAAEVPAARTELLEVEVSGERYGLPVERVAEILRPRPITPVPRTPPWVLGIAGLRGVVLPVLDLALRLGLEPGPESRHQRIVVVRDGEELLGFRVDRVVGVVRLGPSEAVEEGANRFLRGMGRDREGRTLGLLDPEALCEFRVGQEWDAA